MPHNTLKIALTGHIDHGKSTLLGRLLLATNSLPKDKLKEIKKISKDFGKDTELAYLADQLKEEREKNITIETTQVFLKTRKRDYCFIDTPGHLEFIKNMLTGSSHAEAAFLIIDAKEGVQEQTRRHAYLLKFLTLNTIIVIINKMDTVGYDQSRFQVIKDEITSFFNDLDIRAAHIIPISAKQGVNIAHPSRRMPWYKDAALLTAMDSLKIKTTNRAQPLRFPVQDVYRINGEDIAVGKVTSGSAQCGEKISLLPSRRESVINAIKVYGQKRTKAQSQESIGVVLSPHLEVRRGDILCAHNDTAVLTNGFRGNIFWLSGTPLKKNETVTLRCATQECEGIVERIEKRINPATLTVLEEDATELKINEAGIVNLKLTSPAVIEEFSAMPQLGRYIVERNSNCQGAGTVMAKSS